MVSRIRQQGFTLVELTVVLTILGLLAAGGLAVSASMVEKANYVETRKQIDVLKETLHNYYMVNGRLPCPARTTDLPGSANFGMEVSNCAAGGVIAGTTHTGNIRIGMIPVRTLGLTDTAAQDRFGARILYAVTEALTDADSFAGNSGAITVLSSSGSTLTTEAAYTILSHGKDRRGATIYLTGNAASPTCAAGTTQRDLENCNNNASFRDAPFNNGSVADQWFDDVILWTPKFHLSALGANSDSLWSNEGETNPQDIHAVGTDADVTTGHVGIGTINPLRRLHVKGATLLEAMDNEYLSLSNPSAPANLRNWVWADDVNTGKLTLRSYLDNGSAKANLLTADHSTGYLGVGTTTPSHRLHVKGSAMVETEANRYLTFANPAAPANLRNWVWEDESNTGKLLLRSYLDNWNLKSNLISVDHSTGYVGLGTTSPLQKLHVKGTVFLEGDNDFYMYINRASAPAGLRNWALQDISSAGKLVIRSRNDDLTSKATLIAMDHSTGNVGIATDTPAQKLHVNGIVRIGSRLTIDPNLPYQGVPGTSIYGSTASNEHLTLYAQNNSQNGASITLAGRTSTFWGDGRITYRGSYDSSGIAPLHQFWRITSGGTAVMLAEIQANGNVFAANSFYSGSDVRLKNVLGPIKSPLDKISQLNGVYFRWNEKAYSKDEKTVHLGLLAQDVQKVLPEAVQENADGYLTVSYNYIIPLLTEAVKELKAENDALKAAIAEKGSTPSSPYDPFRDWRIWVLIGGVLAAAVLISRCPARK